jgi:hypothetical protein
MSLTHGVVVSSRLVEVPLEDDLDGLASDEPVTRGPGMGAMNSRARQLQVDAAETPVCLVAPNPSRSQQVQECVGRLLELCGAGPAPAEKRSHRRFPFRVSLVITPVNNITGKVDDLKSFAAFGIDLSPTGVCFLARQLVAARRAVVSCEGPDRQPTSLLFEPRWVRFTRGGWYQTGGRLLDVVNEAAPPPPTLRLFDMPPDFEQLTHKVRA